MSQTATKVEGEKNKAMAATAVAETPAPEKAKEAKVKSYVKDTGGFKKDKATGVVFECIRHTRKQDGVTIKDIAEAIEKSTVKQPASAEGFAKRMAKFLVDNGFAMVTEKGGYRPTEKALAAAK